MLKHLRNIVFFSCLTRCLSTGNLPMDIIPITLKTFMSWPNATVPFYIYPSHFDQEQSIAIMTSLSMFAFKTCIKFAPVMSEPQIDQHVMTFINPEGVKRCKVYNRGHWSSQPHIVILGYECLQSPELEMFIMRALGFPFEHNRMSRDVYIDVQTENVEPSAIELFTKDGVLPPVLRALPYDINSVMHFGERDYSKNGHRTIIIRNRSQQHRKGLTTTDLKKIELVYGPECRRRDRQEKIELCQSYPGVVRRKRSIDPPEKNSEPPANRSLRINPNITPPSTILIGGKVKPEVTTDIDSTEDNTDILNALGIAKETDNILERLYEVSTLALKNARVKYCNTTQIEPNNKTNDNHKQDNVTDVLKIKEIIVDYAKSILNTAERNAQEFCEKSLSVEEFLKEFSYDINRRYRIAAETNKQNKENRRKREVGAPESSEKVEKTKQKKIEKTKDIAKKKSDNSKVDSTPKLKNVSATTVSEPKGNKKAKSRRSSVSRKGFHHQRYRAPPEDEEDDWDESITSLDKDRAYYYDTKEGDIDTAPKMTAKEGQSPKEVQEEEVEEVEEVEEETVDGNEEGTEEAAEEASEEVVEENEPNTEKPVKSSETEESAENVKNYANTAEEENSEVEGTTPTTTEATTTTVESTTRKKKHRKKSHKKKVPVSEEKVDKTTKPPKKKHRSHTSTPRTVKLTKLNEEFYADRKWSDGTVVYVIQKEPEFDLDDLRGRLKEVNSILKKKTCVKLKEVDAKEANGFDDYLVLDTSPDYVTGRVGGKQIFGSVELFRGNEHRQHTAMMVMAMLGFYFEVARHDRDRHIRVHMRHVRPDKLHHFEKIRDEATLDLPYDYKSATHPAFEFWRKIGKTGIATVATFKEQDPDGSVMRSLGQNEELLSEIDIIKINSIYGTECFDNKRTSEKVKKKHKKDYRKH